MTHFKTIKDVCNAINLDFNPEPTKLEGAEKVKLFRGLNHYHYTSAHSMFNAETYAIKRGLVHYELDLNACQRHHLFANKLQGGLYPDDLVAELDFYEDDLYLAGVKVTGMLKSVLKPKVSDMILPVTSGGIINAFGVSTPCNPELTLSDANAYFKTKAIETKAIDLCVSDNIALRIGVSDIGTLCVHAVDITTGKLYVKNNIACNVGGEFGFGIRKNRTEDLSFMDLVRALPPVEYVKFTLNQGTFDVAYDATPKLNEMYSYACGNYTEGCNPRRNAAIVQRLVDAHAYDYVNASDLWLLNDGVYPLPKRPKFNMAHVAKTYFPSKTLRIVFENGQGYLHVTTSPLEIPV